MQLGGLVGFPGESGAEPHQKANLVPYNMTRGGINFTNFPKN